MKKAISAKRKRGRPATGAKPMIGFRADGELRAEIEKWAKAQPDKPKLSNAIRQLVELGLAHGRSARYLSPKSAEEAKQLAAKAIEGLVDPEASTEEAANRKRRLLRGPEEFRDLRVDHRKKT
jgi:hypothetical protein